VVYLANFLAVATTSLLAGALAKNDIVAARRHVSCAFSISLAVSSFPLSPKLYTLTPEPQTPTLNSTPSPSRYLAFPETLKPKPSGAAVPPLPPLNR